MKRIIIITILISFLSSNTKSQTFNLNDSIFKVGDVLHAQLIFFEFGKADILKESHLYLNTLSDFFKNNNQIIAEIGVHFDERYPNDFSTCLSCMRADAIRTFLINSGVRSDRLTSHGYNDSKPKIVNARTEEEHQQNRRIEIKIIRID